MKRICIFAGSSAGSSPVFAEQTRILGQALASRGIELVYGGARSGLMGAAADEVLAHGGTVTGIMPTHLFEKEVPHPDITKMIEVDTLHERKAKMSELADGFIALPGGFGTLEELFETVSWAQIGIHQKPVALFNIDGYYTPVMNLVEHSVKAGFVKEEHQDLMVASPDPHQLLDEMEAKEKPDLR
ncbi:TIGR00730 family Rossman fold protein [Halobacillus litoralis]|uniref:Cytokinin riboside 5'-monophosphate phosphoribohydrolase n=1 Tax=Halobacillus litoralis TaxID=45668 RepID=A0A845DV19_9BACI|nr:TIGR00730 family Rossman fold protein [Halobacillus litoralis]